MKKCFILSVLLVLAAALLVPAAVAQTTGTVKGVCKDMEGNVLAGADVELTGVESGHKYSLKTNKKGEYFTLGIVPGKYNAKLSKDGKEIWHINNVTIGLDEVTLDFDLKKEASTAVQGTGMSAEQAKAATEQREKAAKEQNTVKALNEKLGEANAAMDAKDFDKAIATLSSAIEMDSTRDLLYFKLGDAYRLSAPAQTDSDEKKKRFEQATTSYQKAIDVRKGSEQAAKDPDNNKKFAAYYNNLAEAYSKSYKIDESIKNYDQAAQLDADHAATYYFNEGAVLTNAGRADDAVKAFDRVIAADPTKALAYYWKGINLIGKATVGKDNKMVAPDGTSEAFNKYLELEPNGSMADTAKQMLASIGATVETGFGTSKKKAPPKK